MTSEYLPDSFKNLNISMVAVDEALLSFCNGDMIFVLVIAISKCDFNSLRIKPIISAFTATATPEVKQSIINLLDLNNLMYL